MTARWAEALDAQLDAWKWYREGRGEQELQGFAESFIGKILDLDDQIAHISHALRIQAIRRFVED